MTLLSRDTLQEMSEEVIGSTLLKAANQSNTNSSSKIDIPHVLNLKLNDDSM